MVWKLYHKYRVVHINVNAIIAGVLSLIISSYLVFLTYYLTNDMIAVLLISYVVDGAMDFVIFAGLHLIAYRGWFSRLSFAKILARDIAYLQTHRALLAIITLIIGVGVQFILMQYGLGRARSFIIAYGLALLVTRTGHTIYGLKTGLFKPLHLRHKKINAEKD